MSADARVARAIREVHEQLGKTTVPLGLHRAILDLIDEVKDALHLSDDDIEGYR